MVSAGHNSFVHLNVIQWNVSLKLDWAELPTLSCCCSKLHFWFHVEHHIFSQSLPSKNKNKNIAPQDILPCVYCSYIPSVRLPQHIRIRNSPGTSTKMRRSMPLPREKPDSATHWPTGFHATAGFSTHPATPHFIMHVWNKHGAHSSRAKSPLWCDLFPKAALGLQLGVSWNTGKD